MLAQSGVGVDDEQGFEETIAEAQAPVPRVERHRFGDQAAVEPLPLHRHTFRKFRSMS